ncbi:hypothetical protein FTO70_14890 [Methanosarcina sp. KYL-1]|uniref:hypothetical protein n=1 Tax=Methanosarcina sp. KYL-1 TaxID=2602068 RepID=UPI00210180D8|nr:hypothetical protein [Methanosarcina sp. KYL-1]MCQ1536936.1 hypothetical protein [Methanosarcina sp. KYL-1]
MEISLIVLFLIVLGIGALNYHTNKLYEESFSSSYEYDITLETDSELRNVTLYLPLPLYEGESAIGNELTGRISQETRGGDLSIEDTEHGKMLSLRTDKFVPGLRLPPEAISDAPEVAKELTETGDTEVAGQSPEEALPLDEYSGNLSDGGDVVVTHFLS